jgi:hypothetical protein
VISYAVEAVGSSKTSGDFLQTTWNYTPKDSVLYNHYEVLKYYRMIMFLALETHTVNQNADEHYKCPYYKCQLCTPNLEF